MAEHISNTSPLLYLHQAGALDVLASLYREIIIPAQVQAELREGRRLGFDAPDTDTLPWIRVQAALPVSQVAAFELDGGESAVLSLAVTRTDCVVLLDDGPARRAARALGLPVVGTLGVLVAAKRVRILPLVCPLLDKLVTLGFRLTPALRRSVLAQSGEDPEPL
jgi:uncharacterized protein